MFHILNLLFFVYSMCVFLGFSVLSILLTSVLSFYQKNKTKLTDRYLINNITCARDAITFRGSCGPITIFTTPMRYRSDINHKHAGRKKGRDSDILQALFLCVNKSNINQVCTFTAVVKADKIGFPPVTSIWMSFKMQLWQMTQTQLDTVRYGVTVFPLEQVIAAYTLSTEKWDQCSAHL